MPRRDRAHMRELKGPDDMDTPFGGERIPPPYQKIVVPRQHPIPSYPRPFLLKFAHMGTTPTMLVRAIDPALVRAIDRV